MTADSQCHQHPVLAGKISGMWDTGGTAPLLTPWAWLCWEFRAGNPSRAVGGSGGSQPIPSPACAVLVPLKQCEVPSLWDHGEQSGAVPCLGVWGALLCPVLPPSMDFFELCVSFFEAVWAASIVEWPGEHSVGNAVVILQGFYVV